MVSSNMETSTIWECIHALIIIAFLNGTYGNPSPLDLAVSPLVREDQSFSAAALYQDKDVTYDFDFVVTNKDVNRNRESVYRQTTTNNFDVKVKVTSRDLTTTTIPSVDVSRQFEVTLSAGFENVVKQEIPAGSSVTIRGSTVINVDRAICNTTTYLCVGIEVSTDPAVLTDNQPLNNYACVKLEDWYLHACTRNTVDLRADVFDVVDPLVRSGGAVTVELLLWVELGGTAQTRPFRVQAYLCRDRTLDPLRDKQLEHIPVEFDQTLTVQTTSTALDLSGPGLALPDLHLEDSQYCGAVYLAVLIDGPGLGANNETNERNNVKITPLTILCPKDILSVQDFTYDLGQKQRQVYINTDTLLDVNVTVCNSHPEGTPFCYGRVNFRLLLYLCLSETFLSADGAISSGCIDVSMRGVSYCQGATPIVGRAVGECVRIKCARTAINGTRFQTYQPYTHLMLMVLPPEGHSKEDEILKNNFLGLPIPISDSRITSSLKDHKISDDFGIPVDILKVGVNGPVDYTDLEFEGHIIVGEAVSGTLVAQLYWSKDCRLDANDPLSGIPVSIEVTPSSVRLIKANHGRTEDIQVGLPADPSYCGTVCAIVYVESGDLANDNLERNKENQIATDQVTLQCHSTDEVALTEMWLVDPPTLTKDVKTPVTFTVTVSCTANTICNSSQEQFHLELSIDSGTGAPESLVVLTSNSHPAIVEYSGDGLESDLTVTRRVTVTFTVNVTISSTCLSRTQRLRVDVRLPDGSSDWPDNNHLTADLPLFKCIVTSTFDIEAGAVRLYPLNNEVRVSEAVPYDFSFKLHVKGHTLPAATSPHIRTAMVVSDDRKVTESDYFLRHFTPESHKRKLSAEWGTGLPPVELDDKCGFTLPADGLERFCDPDTGMATVYIGILLDSYDPDPEDSIRGQLEETLEQNNVAWTEAPVNVSGVKCYCNKPVQKQLIADLRSVVIRAGNPLVEVPVVQSQTEMHFSIEVGITNAHSEVLVPPDGQENFDLRVVIDHSALATPARIIILNSRDIRLLRNTPLEAGGTLVFTILGFLCHEADPEEGCSPENFLPSDQNAEDGCILHDEALFRVFFVASPDNYTTVDDTLGKRVICSGEAYVADPIFVGLPDLFWGSGGRGSGVSPWYAFHYTVRITRYKAALPTAADPPQPATFFLRFVSNGTEVLRTVQTPLTLTIAPGGSVTVSGLGIIKEELDEADCILLTQSAYVQFVVTRTAGRPLPGLQNLGTPTTTCFPADMPEFTDMLVANMTLPEAVTEYGTSIDYTLWVEVDDRAASGNTSFTVDVYLATGPYLSHPHRLIRSFTGNGTTGFSSSSADEQLALAGEQLAWFCYHRDVYLMAHVENNDPSPIDPESVRNTHAEPFYLYCQGDLLTLLAVDGLAAADGAVPLYHSPPGYTNVFVVRVTVANSDFKMRPTIETGLRNQPNFQVEFHYTHDDALWTTLENVKVKANHLPRLHAAIPLNGSVAVEVEVTFEITSALCNVLSSRNGKLRAIIYQGLGLRPGWVDSVPDNDVITFDVQCSEDIVDIFLDTDNPNYLKMDDVSQAGVFGHFAHVTGSFTISARIGNGQSVTTTASNLGYKLLLSRDDQQDDGDFDLSVTVDNLADQYKMVSDDAGTAEPDKKVVFGSAAEFSATIPLEVGCLYCGRVYLLIEVSNPDNSFGDPDLTNNAANISLTINCEEDLYAFWGGWWQGQSHFYPDKAVSLNFGGTVRMVSNGVTSVKILPRHNFDIKVFAQRGSYFERALATDLTPQSSWDLVPDEEGNLVKAQDPSTPFTFSRVSGSVLLTRGVCAEGADHLFIGVMTADAEKDDSVLYNNFYVQPIHVIKHSQLGCGGQDSVDLEVKTHRNGETTFSLTDRSMTINTNHSFELQLLITVEGEGWRTYWEAPPVDGKPVFEVIFTLSDGSYTVEIPHQVDYSLFNTGITRTTTVDLGGVLFLPEGGTLPLCGSTSARLNVLLDPKDHVLETDEGNNMGTITGLTVGGHICSRGFVYDLVAKDLQLAPIPKTWVQSDRADVNQPVPYCFTIESLALPGVASVSLPDALSYRFVVFPTASDDDVVFAENGRLHSTDTPTVSGNVFSWRVCGNLTVESDQADDGPLQLMCGLSPYLGVHLDPDVDDNPDNGVGDAPEVEDIANNIAKLQIKLNCPHISGFGLLEVVVKEGGLSDGVNDVLTVDFRPINKGSRTMLPPLDVYMYLRNDTSLPAEFNAPDLFHQLAPPLNPRPGYDHTWGTSEDRWYRDIDITAINVPVRQCEIAQYLCWELRSTNSTYDPRQDNYVCTPFDDSFYLDCIRDVSLTDLIVATVQVAAIYQDTLIPITFNATIRMTGRTVPPPSVDGDSHIGVNFFLSADDTLDEAEDTLLADHRRAPLDVGVTTSMSSGSVFRLAGRTEVYVSAAQCGGQVFVCARYVFLSSLTPPFREDGSTSNNDYDCFNVTEKMACNEETRDIEPTLFEVPSPYVLVGGSVPFDLHVKVDLRGTTTGGQVTFDSALYLSADAQLDNSDTHVPYPGWQLGVARLEQARHLSTGVHYLNLGGVPLSLTGLTDITHCGPGYLLYVADVGMNVSERYEENNVIAAPIVIGCQGDVAGRTGMVDKLHVTKATLRRALLVAGQDSTVRVSGDVYNVWGRAVPRYQLSLRTDSGVTVTQDGAWRGLPADNLLLLAPGERHRLNDLEVEVSSNLFTDEVCSEMEHLVLCAMLHEDEDNQETYMDNNCMTLGVTELTKMCSANEYVDIRQLGLRVPPTFSLAGPVSVWHDVEVYVGPEAPTISTAQFLSYLHLSRSSHLDLAASHKLGDLPNNIGVPKNRRLVARVTQTDMTLTPPPAPADHCGLAYVHVRADALEEVDETREDNNGASRRVTLTCDHDYFSILDLNVETPEGRFIEDYNVAFQLAFDVTCSRTACSVSRSETSNVIFDLVYRSSNVTQVVTLATVDENWDGQVTPGVGVGFHRPGLVRNFIVTGNLMIPNGSCNPNAHFYIGVQIGFGTSLLGQPTSVDGVPENDIVMVPYPCTLGLNLDGARDLVAMPVTFINTTVEQGHHIPANVYPGKPYHFTFDFGLYGTPLPVRDIALPAAPFNFDFCLSYDDRLDATDVCLGYVLTEGNAAILSRPVGSLPANVTLVENVQGLVFPATECGWRQLLIHLDNSSRIPEVSDINNVAARPIYIECLQDVVSVENVNLTSGRLIQTTTQTLTFDVDIVNSGLWPFAPSGLELRACLSANTTLEDIPQPVDGYLSTDLDRCLSPSSVKPTTEGLMMQPLGPGEVLPLRGLTVEAAVDETNCPLYKYLLVGVRLRDVPRTDDMPLNNYMAVDLPTLCQHPSDIKASVGSSDTLSSQSDATVIFVAYVTGLTIPDLFWNNIRLSLDKVVDDGDLLLSLPETGQNVVGPSPPVDAINHMTGNVRLPNDLDLAYCGRVYAIGEVDVGNHVLELTETNNVFIYPINVACRTTDLMALTVEEASPVTVDLSLPTTLPLTISVHCVQVAALCPASASSAEHMKLRFSLYDWDRQWLVSLMPDELDATNAGSYLSDAELLTGDYSALKIRTAETTGQFVFDDVDLCPLVRYLGVSIVKGDSLEIRTKDLGPAASKTRLVPITADCHPRLIDLEVRRFGYVGQAPVVDMGAPSLVVSLVVDVTSMDYPRRRGHQTLFSYKVSATVAGDPTLNVDDIGYVPSEPIMSLLSTDPVTGQLDLTDTNGIADWPRLLALCGRDDVTLSVSIDSYDDYPETNETNNMAQAEGFAQFKNCLDGVDVKLTRFDLTDLEVASGMSVRVDVDVGVVTVGQFPPEGVETPSPLPPLYSVDFALVDSKTQATIELPVEAGVFIADPLRSIASGDVSAGTAKARSHRLNEIRQLPISSDVILCDRAWFIRARVQLNVYPGIPTGADADLSPKDNVMYRHIYIHCPEDGVALYDVRIMQFPERLWYDSLEYVDFELCVINKGPSIPSPELTFMVTLLFSAFDDVGRAEDEEYKVYTPDEYVYDYRGGLQHGQVYCTGPLQGRFSISSQEVCEKALTEEGSSPNIFFRLDITSEMASMFSPYSGNDIRRLTVNKESLICNQDNVDLMVYAVRVGPGHSGDILAGSNTPYAIELRQKHSLGGNIPRSNPLDDNVSLNVTIYLSNDCGLDPYDDPIPFNYTSEQFYTLKSGVQSSSASTITLEGQNLKIDIKDRLDFSFYCGSSYMLVQVSDLTHMNNQIDPVPENNVHCIPINLQCPQDCISFEKLDVKLTDDQEAFHPRALTDFDVSFRIRFCNDASASKDDRQIVNFRVFMSSDKSLDIKADPEIPATFGEDITTMAKQGFTAGEVVDYRGRLQLDANLIVCVFSPEFLIVLVELGAQPENQDYVRNNNYEYIYTKDLLNCSVSTTDIYVTGFHLTVDNLISPGDHLSFNLSARVDLTGSASLGVEEGDQYVFTYQFYLSTDTMVSADDYRFMYSLVDHQTKLKTKLNTGVNIFDLSSQQELLFLPKDIDKKFCGNSYVIAFLDERREIQEKNEPNNQRAVPVIVICDGDFYSIEDVSMSLQPVYFIKPGFIEMSMTVRGLTGDTSLIGPDEDVMHFRLCIQNVESGDLCHDVTPDAPWAVEGAAVNLTVPPGVGGAVRLERLQNYVDVGPACGAALGRPREGVNRLVVEVRPGGGHNTPGLVDAVSSNSIYMTNVTISCTDEVSDLSVGTFHLLSPEDTSTRILRFGPNPFDLKLAVYTGWRFPIWPPTELPTPQKIYYDFGITLEAEQLLIPEGRLVNVTQNVSLTYNSSLKKDEINKPYTNGQTINLRDTIPGLELPLEKLYQVCLASSIQLEVDIDSRSQQAEINEANNGFTLTGLAPPVDCGSRVDVMVRAFSVPGLTRDTLSPDTAYPYLLEVEVIQTATPASTPFDLHFFISADRNTGWETDGNDVTLSVDLSTSQRGSLRADYQGWSVRSVGGAGLVVPLTQETYPLCWRRAFIGVRADPLETVDTVTFTNNVAMFEVIFDCGADLDECESGLAACDTNATCHDRPFSLQDPRVGDLSVDTFSSPRSPKYQCVCQQGFRQANQQGTLCHDIAECTELPNGSPLHTCNATLHLQCKEQVGNFSCECTPGFKLEDGVCIDFDECKNDTDNDCHVNAQCNNTLGSYNCTCLPGYQGDGRQCQDTDDCGRDSCLNGGVCVDGVNSFSCTCPPSYTGHRCEVVNGNWGPWGPWSGCDAVCGRGVRSRQRACDDPAPSAQGCGCPVTAGVGATDREDCHDRTCQVGACLLQPCDTPMRCFVTNDEEGARECECPSGYRYNATQQCEDIDECVETTETGVPLNDCCDPYGLCENQPGSFRCPCQLGYDIKNGRCMNVDECSAPTSPCRQTNEVCRDTPGSYTCDCKPGYRRRTASSSCLGERLLPFGSEVGDLRLNETSRFTGEYVSPLLPVPRGIPLADRLVHALYVSENGAVIGTDQPMDTSFKDTFQRPRPLPTLTLPNDRGVQALLAAFWADAKLNHHSAVWYQAYTDRSQAVFDEVGHLLVSQGVTGFTPTYILKVTWNNTRPHFWAPPEQGVTFQAFVMTDSETTYFMCIYEEGAMTWFPLYGAQELVLYEGYPAHVGFAARSLDDEMVYYSDPNSGHWNNDLLNTSLNAYRLDGRQLAPQVGGLLGVTLVRADSHGPGYVNPARRCYDWAQAEPPISEWASSLVGACPDVMAKAQIDQRFDPLVQSSTGTTTNSTPGNSGITRCFKKLFSLDEGANIRCCYEEGTGAIIDDRLCRSEGEGSHYDSMGVVHRYQVSSDPASPHQLEDAAPYRWCCLQARSTPEEDYAQMYLDRRPAASSHRYDQFGFALAHGDPHYESFDSPTSLTIDGFGEYVLLWRTASPAVMIQARHNKEPPNNRSAEAKRTYISAVAVRVGEQAEPSIQVYLRRDRPDQPLQVVVGTTDWAPNSPSPDDVAITANTNPQTGRLEGVQLVFRAGLVLQVADLGGRLRLVILLPSSLYGEGLWTGLLGSPDFNPDNDLSPSARSGRAQYLDPDPSADIKYIYGQSWTLINVFGDQTNAKSLFVQYGPTYIEHSAYQVTITSPEQYDDYYFSPNFYPCTDASPSELGVCTPPEGGLDCECLHDVRAAGHLEAGRQIMESRSHFNQLKEDLTNHRPEFLNSPSNFVRVQVGETFSMLVTLHDPDDLEVTFNYSVKDPAGRELLVQWVLPVNGSNDTGRVRENVHVFRSTRVGEIFSFNFTWKMTTAEPLFLEFAATDPHGSTTILRPRVSVCDCKNGGSCQNGTPKRGFFTLADCECGYGWAGPTCELDLDGCNTTCFHGCQDVKADINDTSESQFVCDPCPPGTETDGNSCFQINECTPPTTQAGNDTRAAPCEQVCHKLSDGYTCSCEQGYDIDPNDTSRCIDHPECSSPALNECDKANGYCVDLPEGSYTCHCNPGYTLASDGHSCRDIDECRTNNGGCEGTCVNKPGSYECRCPAGSRLSDRNPHFCLPVNECEDGSHGCDHECEDTDTGYRCRCRQGYILQTQNGTSCRAQSLCTSTTCGPNAYCGLDDVTNVETCYCSNGYRLMHRNLTHCEDIDECAQRVDACDDVTSVCVNVPGKYRCECRAGYKQVGDSPFLCENIDECAETSAAVHGCPMTCRDTIGSYFCTCLPGYSLLREDGVWTCRDVDECSPGHQSPCDPNADCVNEVGAYSCVCRQGFTGNGATCTETLECMLSNGGCELRCRDVANGYRCECISGYRQNPNDTTRCLDINECEWPENPCTHICTNLRGTYSCSCRDGFYLDIDGSTCLPDRPCDNECGHGVCSEADNGVKSCNCYSGYTKLQGNLDECKNRIECGRGWQEDKCARDEHTTCVDQTTGRGGYRCQCDPGYTSYGDMLSCKDIDECVTEVVDHQHNCQLNVSTCVNAPGSFSCVCKHGFSMVNDTCTDIDECARRALQDPPCAHYRLATCTNLPGGYLCQCRPGYRGDGLVCQDIDECLMGTCAENQLCVNTPGSYMCECKPGYKFVSGHCENINECLSPILNNCSRPERCEDIEGSYRCRCYTEDGAEQLTNDGLNCTVLKPCRDPGVESSCGGVCLNEDDRDRCHCDWPQTSGCQDLDECVQGIRVGGLVTRPACDPDHSRCVNVDPGYSCVCSDPWILDPDGRGCSETNGRWGAWSPWGQCSRSCMGSRIRNRNCDDPPPVGLNRYCEGLPLDYSMCNTVQTVSCQVRAGELDGGIFVDFSNLESWHYDKIERYFIEALVLAINTNIDNRTQALLCGDMPQNEVPFPSWLVTADDVHLGRGYPQRLNNTLRVLFVVDDTRMYIFCNKTDTSAQTNSSNPAILTRRRRATTGNDVNSNNTETNTTVPEQELEPLFLLPQSFLTSVFNESEIYDLLDELLYDAQLLDILDLLFPFYIQASYDDRPRTTTPPVVVTEKPPVIPTWAFIVIGVVLGLLLIGLVVGLIVFFVVIKGKKKRKRGGAVGPVHPHTRQPLTDEQKQLVRQKIRERRLRQRQEQLEAEQRERMAMVYGDGDQMEGQVERADNDGGGLNRGVSAAPERSERDQEGTADVPGGQEPGGLEGKEGEQQGLGGREEEGERLQGREDEQGDEEPGSGSQKSSFISVKEAAQQK